MSRPSKQHSPDGDLTSSSGSLSLPAPERRRSRYKPLAPKSPIGEPASRPSGLQRSHSGTGEATQQLQDLTFVNVTDPSQAKRPESRKFVRTQVMKNFAREKRRQKSQTSAGCEPSFATVSAVQELLDVAVTSAEASASESSGRLTSGRASSSGGLSQQYQSSQAPGTAATASGRPTTQRDRTVPQPPRSQQAPGKVSSTVPGVGRAQWPVTPWLGAEDLIGQCYSPHFRACDPQYMISLVANRPRAERYPFSIDIDSEEQLNHPQLSDAFRDNQLYQLAAGSPALAHALLMIGASHRAILGGNDAPSDPVVIYHKHEALRLLSEAIQGLPDTNYLESLATIAVLASHELMYGEYNEWTVHLMGFGRIAGMKGGITSLPKSSLIRKLMIWTDQMGALTMTVRPFFPASDVMRVYFRPMDTIASVLTTPHARTRLLGPHLQDFISANNVCNQIVELAEDVATIALIGAANIQQHSGPSGEAALIKMRTILLHRILSLTPVNHEDDEEQSAEEYIRLTILVLTLDRLFHPVLPPLYHKILQPIVEKLSTALSENADTVFGSKHSRVLLWISFVGATVQEGNRKTKQTFIQSAGPAYDQLFSMTIPSVAEVHEVLDTVIKGPELHNEATIRGFVDDLQEELGP